MHVHFIFIIKKKFSCVFFWLKKDNIKTLRTQKMCKMQKKKKTPVRF